MLVQAKIEVRKALLIRRQAFPIVRHDIELACRDGESDSAGSKESEEACTVRLVVDTTCKQQPACKQDTACKHLKWPKYGHSPHMTCRALLSRDSSSGQEIEQGIELGNEHPLQQPLSALITAANSASGTVTLQLDRHNEEGVRAMLGSRDGGDHSSAAVSVHLHVEQPGLQCTRFRMISCCLHCDLPPEWSNTGFENMVFFTPPDVSSSSARSRCLLPCFSCVVEKDVSFFPSAREKSRWCKLFFVTHDASQYGFTSHLLGTDSSSTA